MKLSCKIACYAGCLLGAVRVSAAPSLEPPTLEYSQDGKHYSPLEVFSGKAKAATYYDFRKHSGHPGFGTDAGLSSAALYWDSRHGLLSLIVIAGAAGNGSGRVQFTLDGLPSTTVSSFSDDPDEYRYKRGKAHTDALYRFNKGADGLVLGGLEQTSKLAVTLSLSSMKHISQWRLVDGDPAHGGSYIDLAMSKPLYVRTAVGSTHVPGDPPPTTLPPTSGNSGDDPSSGDIPEPGSTFLIFGAAGLFCRRRRR